MKFSLGDQNRLFKLMTSHIFCVQKDSAFSFCRKGKMMNFFLTLAMILIIGGLTGLVLNHFRLPALLGYIVLGIVCGSMHWINPEILAISAELRKIALVIILLKAGLSLKVEDLKKIGLSALLLSILPCCFEMCAIGIAGHFILGLSYTESFLLGSVLGAVSPAVVVPRMSRLLDEKVGTDHGVPQMIIAGSSMDDIVMIVFYTTFLSIESGGEVNIVHLQCTVSIILGIVVGLLAGFVFSVLFEKCHLRDSMKLTLLLGTSFLMVYLESALDGMIGYSGLLSVIAMGIMVLNRRQEQAARLKNKCDRLWVVSEIFLFFLVGASIQIQYALGMLGIALVTIVIGLFLRNVGVLSALTTAKLNPKEKTFVCLSYLPKATVQAAIGGGLLDAGNAMNNAGMIHAGTIVLSTAVAAILFTAPLGAILMDSTYKKLLNHE